MARFILSRGRLLEQYAMIEKLGTISYSFKTNPTVGKLLEQMTGCNFSVHFINELKLIGDKSRVWFLAQSLSESAASLLISMGVRKFVVENQQDLETLLSVVRKEQVKIELMLRLKLKENTIRTEKHYVFGMEASLINSWIPRLFEEPFIDRIGIHFHRKTQNVSEWDLVRELQDALSPKTFKSIDYLNIGGGLPVSYKNISDKVIGSVVSKIETLREWLSNQGVELIIEPGRFLSGPCIILETEIVGIHGNTLVVDASVYNSSPDTLIVPIKLLVEGEIENGKAYVIKGITPCSTDIYRYRVYFPSNREFRVGDRIRFLNAGAYNFHTHFCELDTIKTEVVD